jgi:hypothetical protein
MLFSAQAQGMPVEHLDNSQLLSARLITAPRDVTGSSAGYSREMRGPQG